MRRTTTTVQRNYGVRPEPYPTAVSWADGSRAPDTYYYCPSGPSGCGTGFRWTHTYRRHLVTVVGLPAIRYCPSASRFEHPGCRQRHRKLSNMASCVRQTLNLHGANGGFANAVETVEDVETVDFTLSLIHISEPTRPY